MKFKRKKSECSRKGLDSGCSPLKQILCFLKEILLLKLVWKEKKNKKKNKKTKNFHFIPGPWCISGRTTLLLSSTIIAKINTWLALQLLSGWKYRLHALDDFTQQQQIPRHTNVWHPKHLATKISEDSAGASIHGAQTSYKYTNTEEHIHLTKAHRHTCKQTQPGCWCTLIHVHISPQPISQTHHYRPRSNLFVRGEMPRWIIHSSLIH